MAGARTARGARSRYTSAGYAGERADLYIAERPAGSAQEKLVDLNRIGYAGVDYRSARPWRESPEPVLQTPDVATSAPARPRTTRARSASRHEDLSTRLLNAAMREKREAILCAILMAMILLLLASWGQKMVEGVRLQNEIASYQEATIKLEKQNESIAQQIEQAKSGERIRNLAQNNLRMLRPERAQKESLYIQIPDVTRAAEQTQSEDPKMEMLDILLGLLSVFHIGE